MRTSRKDKSKFIGNQGFSLVELIIVVAVLSILMGMFMMGINLIFGLPARECARELKSAIEKTRIDTMGKRDQDAKLVVTVQEDGVYAEEVYGVSNRSLTPAAPVTTKLCDRKVLVLWNGDELKAGDSKTLYFKRETGGFAPDCDFAKSIRIQGGSHSWKLTLHRMTGIVELERE